MAHYCVLPYLGQYSLHLRNRISKVLREIGFAANIRFVFRSSCRISSLFILKDPIPALLKSGVVYLYECDTCHVSYVGQTSRHLKVRCAEHLGISWRSDKPIKTNRQSAIHDHILLSGHNSNYNNFSILSSAEKRDLALLESLYISDIKPVLNIGISSAVVKVFYF